jgi:hypothetical protein
MFANQQACLGKRICVITWTVKQATSSVAEMVCVM